MSIPEFDEHGNLPSGEHVTSWSDFKTRYGYNPERLTILSHIEALLRHLQRAGCRTVYIDGSFVCSKEKPPDYDACWDATGVDQNLIDRSLLNQSEQGRFAIKQRFGGDIRPDMVCPPGTIRPYLKFYQLDREGRAKGIVRFNLSELQL